MSSFDPSSSQSRLKPPPSCIKVVKLASGKKLPSPSSEFSSGSSVRGITKKIVKITMGSSPSETKSQVDKPKKIVSLNKTITLINSHINTDTSTPASKKQENGALYNIGDVEMKRFSSKGGNEKQVKHFINIP